MIVWSGRGFLSVLIFFGILFASINLIPEVYVDDVFGISFLVTGLFSWYFGNQWNTPKRVFTDEETGQQVVFKNRHTLFWIPMQYVGNLCVLAGAVILIQTSLVVGMVATAMLAVMFFVDYQSKKTAAPNKMKRMPRKEIVREETAVTETPEIDRAEKERIRKAKEDPSRFMPK